VHQGAAGMAGGGGVGQRAAVWQSGLLDMAGGADLGRMAGEGGLGQRSASRQFALLDLAGVRRRAADMAGGVGCLARKCVVGLMNAGGGERQPKVYDMVQMVLKMLLAALFLGL